jgi:phage baseplate assembly protein W
MIDMNIDYPYHFSGQGRTADTDDEDHIRDMIEEFLLTNPGERVNRPDFGSGLLQMVFAPNSPEMAATLQLIIQAGLQRWLGDLIEVRSLEVSSEESKLMVVVKYAIRRTGQVTTQTFERGGLP